MQNKSSIFASRTLMGMGVAIVLFVAVNVVFLNFMSSARLDMTQGKLYTLSDGMRETLAKIDEPITLNFYFSDKLQRLVPAFGIYGVRVRDFLHEITNLSKGKIKLQIFDPEPFSELEDQALASGLQGVPIDQSGAKVYFGLVATNATDAKEVIPFFQPEKEKFLEYDLARLVNSLANPKKPVIGIISSIPFEDPGQQQEPWMILDQIRQNFILRNLFDPSTIEDDVDVMMLVHPQELKPETLYALDQFMLRGGKLLAFVDPLSEHNANSQTGQNPYMPQPEKKELSSTLKTFFDHWGIQMSTTQFVGDRGLANRVNMGGAGEVKPVQFLPWLRLTAKNINAEDMVTANLKVINLASAGALKKTEKSTLTFTPLLSSTQDAMLIDTKELTMMPDAEKLLKNFAPANENYVMAARLSGKVTTAFPNGKPKVEPDPNKKPDDAEKKAEPKAHLTEGTLNAIVIADTDMLENRFWVKVQNFFGQSMTMAHANNADLIINSLENLSGSNALISLRSRGTSSRPFTKIQEIQDAAEQNYKDRAEALQNRLQAAEKQINQLQAGEGDGKVLTGEQQMAIDNFRAEVINTRKELRQVKLALNQDITGLSRWVQFINIGLIPLGVFLLAIFFAIRRSRKPKLKTA
jgi:ABC-type uncharacterized transport system involved in gliding motility auxiliary subunit